MKVYFTAKCPYCGHENKYVMERESMVAPAVKMAVYTCDVDEGGCDFPFVVSIELKPTVTIRGIDGMMDAYQKDQAEKNYEGPVGLQHP